MVFAWKLRELELLGLALEIKVMVLVGVVIAIVALAGVAIYFVANKNLGSEQATQKPRPPQDSSDNSLDKDIASFDAQLKAYETDSSNVDESMNDQPDTLQE